MPSDLENSLVKGGLNPAAAKILANAIDNAATGRVRTGRQLSDATPRQQMRVIDSDTRRYVLTNLDSMGAPALPRPTPPAASHPYEQSQPASADPTIATPSVKAGKFIASAPVTTNGVAQSEITLRITTRGGPHARMNSATGEIEAVPISVDVAQEQFVDAAVEERPEGTVIKIALKNLKQFELASGTKFWGFA